MRYFSLFFLLVLLCTVYAEEKDTTGSVVSLSTSSFSPFLKDHAQSLVLVKFYAPWCTHCKALAPEYEAAAKALEGKAILAEVDCTVETSLCTEQKLEGYPTILLFNSGEESVKFSGDRTASGIIDFVEVYRHPSLRIISTEKELEELRKVDRPCALLISGAADSPAAIQFGKWAVKFRAQYLFVLSTEKSITPSVVVDKLTVLRGNETEVYEGDQSEESVEAFLKLARTPFFGEISQRTLNLYNDFLSKAGNKIAHGWILVNESLSDEELSSFSAVGKKYRSSLVMTYVYISNAPGLQKHLGVNENASLPAFALVKDSKNYVLSADAPVTANKVSKFIDDFLAGSISPIFRSESIPEVETVDGLTTLVGKTIKNYFHKENLLVLFYAPWCGHCKSFKPVYAEFAKKMEAAPIVIAQIDATANDIDSAIFPINGFPTVYFIGKETEPEFYSGGRSLEDLEKYVREKLNLTEETNSSNSDL